MQDIIQNFLAYEETRDETHTQEKRQSTETNHKVTQILKLADKDLKAATCKYAQDKKGK